MPNARFARCARWIAVPAAPLLLTSLLYSSPRQTAGPARYNLGQPVSAEDLAAIDIDVRPDGKGLPDGRGTVADGAQIYAAKCIACHGPSGVEGPNDKLVTQLKPGEFPFGTDPTAPRTIGSYWPYATTLFDYLRRAMPLNAPGSLSNDEVYSLTAYLLYRNHLVESTAVMDKSALPRVKMPAASRFTTDDRLKATRVR